MSEFAETIAQRLLRDMRERQRQLGLATGPPGSRRLEMANSIRPPAQDIAVRSAVADIATPAAAAGDAGDLRTARSLARQIASVDEAAGPAAPKRLVGAALTSVSDLGPLIRDARRAMKLNQSEFAAHAGVGRRFLSELEGGKPSLEFDRVLACAAAAGIDVFARKRFG